MTLEETKEQVAQSESRLSQLKEDKHQLFLQLKKVLNEDDSRKKIKESNFKYKTHTTRTANMLIVDLIFGIIQRYDVNTWLSARGTNRGSPACSRTSSVHAQSCWTDPPHVQRNQRRIDGQHSIATSVHFFAGRTAESPTTTTSADSSEEVAQPVTSPAAALPRIQAASTCCYVQPSTK